jgi:hypothetical protein
VWDTIINAALEVNPAFNVYRIFDVVRAPPLSLVAQPLTRLRQYPILWDVLGFPGSFPQVQTPIYFDRTDVKKAIHAPTNVSWTECSNLDVFAAGPDGNDASLPSAFTVLPNVIEKSKRTVIMHGLADFILLSGGTRIAIQKCASSLYDARCVADQPQHDVGGQAGLPVGARVPELQGRRDEGADGERACSRPGCVGAPPVRGQRGAVLMRAVQSAFQGMQYLTGQRDTP